MYVFAYGSLIWNPGFDYEESLPALVLGWQRRWCVRSTVHRGTPDLPGVVLGLVPGGSCVGKAFRVKPEHAREVRAYLDRREMSETGYVPLEIPVLLPEGQELAVTYVSVAAADVGMEELAEAVAKASGESGDNGEYFRKAIETVESLPPVDGWPRACPGLPSGSFSAPELFAC